MIEPSSVSHVYGKSKDNSENLQLANSLRYHNAKTHKVKDWSPEIQRQELMVRKREREDEYIKSNSNLEKPVILFQKKEIHKDVPLSKSLSPIFHNEAFFKVCGETMPVESISHEIIQKKNQLAGKLKVYKHQTRSSSEKSTRLKHKDKINRITKKELDDQNHKIDFYKIEGIEFLPEGFIELDPVLFHDDYRFQFERDKEIFREEQKKIVSKRRLQYSHRDFKKMRKVTIFVVKDFIKDLDQFFEVWFTENKRKMSEEEMIYIAQELQVERETVLHMQEEFLKRKKEKNANTLNIFFQNRNAESTQKLSQLPRYLQEYFFSTNKQDYSKVKSKVMDSLKQKPETTSALTKQSSSLTFKGTGQNKVIATTDSSQRFEEPIPGMQKFNNEGNKTKTPTIGELMSGQTTTKIRDFPFETVRENFDKSKNEPEKTSTVSKTKKNVVEELTELLEKFQKEKQTQTRMQNVQVLSDCDVMIEPKFSLMNCKSIMQSSNSKKSTQQTTGKKSKKSFGD